MYFNKPSTKENITVKIKDMKRSLITKMHTKATTTHNYKLIQRLQKKLIKTYACEDVEQRECSYKVCRSAK